MSKQSAAFRAAVRTDIHTAIRTASHISIRSSATRALAIIVFMLCASGPLMAQRSLAFRLPLESESPEPITFMSAPYSLHPLPGVTLTTPYGYSPAQIRHAYGFDQITNQGAGQIIGIIDAYDDPNAESDLAVFDQQFGLPSCTTANGCFHKIYGGSKHPKANAGWALEISLDIEWAHAIAPKATILLVEATTNSLGDLLNAVDTAVRNGASVVSMSWTVSEFSSESRQDNHFVSTGVTFLAASGDNGTGVAYPASSPDVVGVGGTSLSIDANGNYLSEAAWSGSGGGLSSREREPIFQSLFGIPDNARGYRGTPDVSYNASPATGFAVYDSVALSGSSGWFCVGGTSAGSPQWAALLAISNSMRVANRKARLSGTNTLLYSLSKQSAAANFHPITSGTNGACGAMCTASTGYDYVTGIGTPVAASLITILAAQ
jgi:subtilase family serine protease